MRGLALATLFLGLCLIDTRDDGSEFTRRGRTIITFVGFAVFFLALATILSGLLK
jgi:hypothetical protein